MLDHHNELCWTCVHESSCMTLDRPGRPVLECEEFMVVAGRQPATGEDPWPTSRVQRRPAHVDGLCFDCEDYGHCSLRTLEGGIWHCEEYR